MEEQGFKRLGWDDYFLGIAQAVSKRSTCLRRQYGAVIVQNNVIVSTGYNGAAVGRENCCDRGTCIREELGVAHGERYELCHAVHAEANAVINGDPVRMRGATLYIYGEQGGKRIEPAEMCMMCERVVRNAGISRVVC